MKEDIENVLIAPIQIEFTDHVKKIRNNLMIVSFVSLFITIGGIQIDPNSSFFGLKFQGLNGNLIVKGFLIVISYLFVHFMWSAYESLQEWEVRVTGTKKTFFPTDKMDIDEIVKPEYPSDPRNSTFYFWWSKQAHRIGNLKDDIVNILSRIEEMETYIHKRYEEGSEVSHSDVNISVLVQPLKIDFENSVRTIDRVEKVIKSNQLLVSMKTFDRRYRYFLNSQNLRWFIIDFSAPVVLATLAIAKMVASIL